MEKQRAIQRNCRRLPTAPNHRGPYPLMKIIPMLNIVRQKDIGQQEEPFFEHHAPSFHARQEFWRSSMKAGVEMVMLFSGGETHLRSICARQDWSFRGPHGPANRSGSAVN
jgi:hypothetical protein